MSDKSLFQKSSLRRRVFLLSSLGMLLMLTILGLSDYFSMQQSIRQNLEEHQVLAQSFAVSVETIMRRDFVRLQEVPFARAFSLEDDDPAPERAALHSAWLQCTYSGVFLLNATGQLLWIEPPQNQQIGANYGELEAVKNALLTGKPSVSNLLEVTAGRHTALTLIPVRKDGTTQGVVGGHIDLNASVLKKILQSVRSGYGGRLEILDGNQAIVCSTDRQLESLETARYQKTEVVARAAIPGISWTVNMIQPASEVFAPVESMKRRFLGFGLLFFALTLLLAWGVTRSVITPVQELTIAAEKIASGNLTEVVPIANEEEIGTLGRTLDEMRKRLKELLETVETSNRELERRVEERTKEVQNLLHKIISAQEDERKRIARDLHDDLSQSIAALLIALESLKTDDRSESDDGLNQVRKLAVHSLDSIHRMIFDLRPSILDDLGLSAAIRWYADQRLKPADIKIYFEGDASDLRLPGQIETALFRIAQEAITNIARHSKAETVFISLETQDDSLVLEVEDDGQGFDMAEASAIGEKGRGLGLQGMKERVHLLGGKIVTESSPGNGTRIMVTVPISRAV